LDDAVGDELDVGVKGDGRATKDQPRGTTGRLSRFVDQLGHLIKARLGATVADLDACVVTQHPEQSAHLQKRLARRLTDRREPLRPGRGKSGNGEPSGLSLDCDHRYVVGDYVVQLPRDAGPLAPCGVVDQRVGDDLACCAVLFRLAACLECDATQEGDRGERSEQDGEHGRLRCGRARTDEGQDEERRGHAYSQQLREPVAVWSPADPELGEEHGGKARQAEQVEARQ